MNEPDFFRILIEIVTVVLLPVLLFIAKVLFSLNKTVSALQLIIFGPQGDNGIYGTVKKMEPRVEEYEYRIQALERSR